MSSEETWREFCRRYREAWNSRDPERVLALATPDVRWLDPSIPGGRASGAAEVRSWLVAFWRAFPDIEFEPLYEPEGDPLQGAFLSADRKRAAVPWRCRGTMLGPIEPPGLAPTGARLELTGVDLYELRGELVSEVRTIVDLAEAGRQLGLMPAPGSAAERLAVRLQRLLARFRRRGRPDPHP